ncbi:WD40-repeat-containing domain protein [Gaertneriomyces semiglobifer]|nr:WD40-repeat-containing domain protein [Gaertneriomyces semiglobifer]
MDQERRRGHGGQSERKWQKGTARGGRRRSDVPAQPHGRKRRHADYNRGEVDARISTRPNRGTPPTNSTPSHTSEVTSTPASGGAVEIPGYYWDSSRNRYFKIEVSKKSIPSSSQYTASAIRERQLTETVLESALAQKRSERYHLTNRARGRPLYVSPSLPLFLCDRQTGSTPQRLQTIAACKTWEALVKHFKSTHMLHLHDETAACLAPVSDFKVHKSLPCVALGRRDGTLSLVKVGRAEKIREERHNANDRGACHRGTLKRRGRLRVLGEATSSPYNLFPITSVHFAHSKENLTIISTTLGGTSSSGKLRAETFSEVDNSFSNEGPLTCVVTRTACNLPTKREAYSSATQYLMDGETIISLGSRSVSYLARLTNTGLHMVGEARLAGKTDILAQCWNSTATVMFSGTRSGVIHHWDVREKAFRQVDVNSMRHPSSICCLQTWDQRIMSAAMDGSMYLWDLRNSSQPVMSLQGQVNSHTSLKFCMNDDKSIVFSGGQDGWVRAWGLRTGEMVLQRPSDSELRTQGGGDIVVSWREGRLPEMTDAESLLWVAQGDVMEVWGM